MQNLPKDIGSSLEIMFSAIYHVLVKEADVIIDIGANGGLHTIPLAKKVGSKGLVYAFEPQAAPLESLSKWLKYEGILKNVEIYNCALGNENKVVNFYVNHFNAGLSTLKLNSQKDIKVSETIEIKLRKLDTLLLNKSNLNNLTLIKIDIEGGERDAIYGGLEIIKKYKPIIAFESGFEWSATRFGYNHEDFISFFDENNYVVFDFFGTKVTKDNFSHKDLIYMLIAFPQHHPHKDTILRMLHDFKENLMSINLPQEWKQVMELVSDPLKNDFFKSLVESNSRL